MSINKNKKKSSRVEEKMNKKINNSNNQKKKAKKKKFSFFSFVFSLFLIIVILFCTAFGYYFVKEGFDVQKAYYSLMNNSLLQPKQITVLVLGVSTDITSELTDTIMVCSYNPKNQEAFILSIPRDTFVGNNKNSAKGADKINSMYSRKGVKETIQKVEEITGLDIDYYVTVKNDALIQIVDSIGGINFNVPINMNYDDPTQDLHIHLDAGEQMINGEKAEQLLRFRHNNDGTSYPSSYGDNDFGRMRTQREFMVETAKQTLKLKNVLKLNKIVKAVFDNVETNMSFFTASKYIPSVLNFKIDQINTYQLPGESKKLNSLWFFVHNQEETNNLIENIKINK